MANQLMWSKDVKTFLIPLFALGVSFNALANNDQVKSVQGFDASSNQEMKSSNFYDRKAEGWYWYQDDKDDSYEYNNVPDHENKNGKPPRRSEKNEYEKHNLNLPAGAYKTPAIIEPTDGL